MKAMQRLGEMKTILEEDSRIARLAQQVVDHLAGLSAHCRQDVQASETALDELHSELWNRLVEPAERTGNMTEKTWQMANEGVIIDHLIRLWIEPDMMWWQRATALVAGSAAGHRGPMAHVQ